MDTQFSGVSDWRSSFDDPRRGVPPMSGTVCRISTDGECHQPASLPVWWVCLWIAWGALGGTTLVALDRDWVGAAIWLLIGGAIGIAGPKVGWLVRRHYFDTLQRQWDNPYAFTFSPSAFELGDRESWVQSEAAKVGLIVAPAFGLFYGILLGPLFGVVASWQTEAPGWSGALEGLAIWWAFISTVAAIVTAVMWPRVLGSDAKNAPPRWMHLASPLFEVLAIVNCMRTLFRLPRQRQILHEYTHRGAVFGWDGVSAFHRINFRAGDFTDADFKALRWFPDLDHLNLTGTRVTDAGLAHVARLKRLHILDLSRTRITDEGIPSLLRLTKLWYLDLRATAVTDEAAAALRVALPRCEISQ